MSKDADIINALKTRLQTILVTGGYQTNIGAKVEIWRDTDLGAADLPMIMIADTETAHDNSAIIGMTRNIMTVNVDAVATGTVATARSMRADLKKCLYGYETIGGLANFMVVLKSSVGTQHHESRVAAAHLELEIEYDTAKDAI